MTKDRIFLIGGTSNTGKSTLAKHLASKLGRDYYSTDMMARHPGRPWKDNYDDIPERVVEHYLTLAPEELLVDVTRHYTDNIKPIIIDTLKSYPNGNLVLEGSAIMPEFINTKDFENVNAIWLTAGFEFLKSRIYDNSKYYSKTKKERVLIDKFLQRSYIFDVQIMKTVKANNLQSINLDEISDINKLTEMLVKKV
jgi:2-phosphoglycerate kinase